MMTRDEIIKEYEAAVAAHAAAAAAGIEGAGKSYELFKAGLDALRPVSREQIEQLWPGCEACKDATLAIGEVQLYGGFNGSIDVSGNIGHCPNCGRPLTSTAVEEMRKRMEELKDATD